MYLSKDLKAAYNKLLDAEKAHLKIKTHLEPFLKNLLEELKLPIIGPTIKNSEKNYLTDPKYLFIVSDENAQLYCDKAQKIYIEEGYEVEQGYSPILLSEHEVRLAEKKFIEESIYLAKPGGLNLENLTRIDIRDKYLVLTKELVGSIMNKKANKTKDNL